MLEVTGLGNVLRALTYVYWLLAIGALALALVKGNGWRRKVIWSCVVVVVFGFLPVKALVEKYQRDAFAKKAWAYFEKMCDERSGYKIYKTFTGVKSVLVTKPLPPATEKDLYDQFWYGDPYSAPAHSERGLLEALTLTLNSRRPNGATQRGLEFVEVKDNSSSKFIRISRPQSHREKAVREIIERPSSRFGVAWEDISSAEDRKHWVAGSRFSVTDLADNSLVAERIGFYIEAGFGSTSGGRRPWLTSRGPTTTCPPLQGGDYSDTWFIANVFKLDLEP